MSEKKSPLVKRTFLSYVLTAKQDAWINYFVPSVASFLLYVFLFASDVAVIFRHCKEDNPIWASLTVFVMCLPSLCSYVVIISSWELWPDMEGCERDNCVWFIAKTLQHALFPVWAIWRFAERMFWSIEAVRATDDEEIVSATNKASAPRTIELYFFFQAFLHSLPQMLIQLNILMRQDYNVDKQTADAEVLSFVFNLTKVAATVAFYQRFKTQKLAGKQYPWFKSNKIRYGRDEIDSKTSPKVVENRPLSAITEGPPPSDSRRSSDFYMEPDQDDRPVSLPKSIYSQKSVTDNGQGDRPVSVPKSIYSQKSVYSNKSMFSNQSAGSDEPDFNIRRVAVIKGLPEDDLAGKLVSFLWWSCFLLARILAISAFFYFYQTATCWLLFAHVLVVISFLIYDVKSDDVKRAKALFFVFIGLIYIFCIIEFKIKFKKTKFIYTAYFTFVFLQNFIMCMIWWYKNIEDLRNDFWFKYIFYIVIMGSLTSVTSMLLYLHINKPKKIVVGQRILS